MNLNELEDNIFKIRTSKEFEKIALQVFEFQYQNNIIYKKFCDCLKKTPKNVENSNQIPFVPIGFFKTQNVQSGLFNPEIIFSSSGTTSTETSKHAVKKLEIYERSFLTHFEKAYPNWKSSTIIGLLPSYLERSGSSLIYMVDHLIQHAQPGSGFALKLTTDQIELLTNEKKPIILFGVTFALLELAGKNIQLKNTTIIETGGMKGRGKEITRDELHSILNQKLSPTAIHSEYGMTELLSQAYLQKEAFTCPNWMKIYVREPADPLSLLNEGRGAINVIDLANLYSCSFIATDDLGKLHHDGSFEVLGRLDHSQIRGCNLLVL